MSSSHPPTRDSAKQRARRVPLDYYQRLTTLDAAKWLLTGLACIATGGYVLWALGGWLLGGQQAARQFSPGPVVAAHAAWEGECAACHTPGSSLRGDAHGTALVAAALALRLPADRATLDAACKKCHAGPEHHASQRPGDVQSCAACHRDHHGRMADIARVDDHVCTVCHGNIAGHREGPSQLRGNVANVTSFPGDHPAFRSLAESGPRKLKFNHKLHMLPGQAASGAKGAARKRLGAIDQKYWAGLAGAMLAPKSAPESPSERIVQLQCEYCHQPEATMRATGSRGGGEVPSDGAYMQPIRFEQHCAACHNDDLAVDVAGGGDNSTAKLPHGLLADEIDQFLWGLTVPRQGPRSLSPANPVQPIPGKTPGANLAQTTEPAAATRVEQAQQQLMGEHRCGKCHQFDGPAVEPPHEHAVWLRHARFDHSAHRAMQCYDCHDRQRLVATGGEKPPLDDPAPLIPNIDNCRQCHSPTTAANTAGARHDCAECHRYHGGHLAPHGKGILERGVPADRRAEPGQWLSREFLRGRPAASEVP